MKPWEIIAHNLSKAGWNWGCVSVIMLRTRSESAKLWSGQLQFDVVSVSDPLPTNSLAHRHSGELAVKNVSRGEVASFEGVFVNFPILHDDDEVFLRVLDELDVGGRVAVD